MSAEINNLILPGYKVFPEPLLRFGSIDPSAVDTHPLKGLLQYGPYSGGKVAAINDPVRIGIISPFGRSNDVIRLLSELDQTHDPKERKAYLPQFPGYTKVFRSKIVRAGENTVLELPKELKASMDSADKPYRVLADAISRAIYALRNVQSEYDVLLILLTEDLASGFYGTDEEDFDLHDYIKALSASLGICVQMIREEKALNYRCRCSVMWRLSIALYTKAGGIPWVLADVDPDTAYIGIDYALRPGSTTNRYAICCSQVFDAEGSGLEFVAYEADGVQMFGKNPYLYRDQMLKVMSRSLSIYQRKHAGASPKRIVVHKNTEFKQAEIDGVFDAFPNADNIELIYVQSFNPWNATYIPEAKKPHGYPCLRGSSMQLGPYETLLWTQGNAPSVAGGGNYFKEGKGIPEPLLLTRYAGTGSFDDVCRETLALTKMDWNNDGPYDRLPVTLNLAGTLATIVKRMNKLEPRSYPVRLFM